MKTKKLAYDVNEMPPIGKSIILALQHVFAMFGATVLVPILVNAAVAGAGVEGEALSIAVALVTAGLGTLIYIACTRAKSPVFLGSSFAFISPIAAAYIAGGLGGAMTGVMLIGIIYFIVSMIIRFAGKKWIDKVLPPIVIGPMIMIIGLSLAGSAVNNIFDVQYDTISYAEVRYEDGKEVETITNKDVEIEDDSVIVETKSEDEDGKIVITKAVQVEKVKGIQWKGPLVALITFLTTALVMTRAKGFFKIIPFLVGIVVGYISACIFGLVNFDAVSSAAWFQVPNFHVPFVHYKPSFWIALTMAPIALVTMAEHIGDHKALSAIIDRDLLQDPGLENTLMGDGIATFAAGLLGGPANTTYGENTSVVGMTRNASVGVIGLAAVFAIILGFLGKFTALVQTIPNPVLGGVCLLLYGFISVNGLKVLIQNQTDFSQNKNIIIASAMLVLGLGGAAFSIATGNGMSVSISGMSLAAIVGIILNLLLPNEGGETEELVATNSVEDLKEAIKSELTVELKDEILEEIRKEILEEKKAKNK